MRVFVTGATGFVGSAVVRELLDAGHRVLGLARSETGAAALAAAGAEVQIGSLDDLEGLKTGAAATDAVIHTAFIHDFSNFAASIQTDAIAIGALTDALANSDRPLIVTSGTLGLPPGRLGTEDDEVSAAAPRRSEAMGLAAVTRGVRAMVIRLPPSVHGDGDHGFVPALVKSARDRGFSLYVGDGQNRWPAVHRSDAARVYRLALEKGAAGARFHPIGDEGIPLRTIAEVIARRVGVPAVSKTAAEATELLGFIGHAVAMDASASGALTEQRLGYRPTGVGLLEDLERGHYFDV